MAGWVKVCKMTKWGFKVAPFFLGFYFFSYNIASALWVGV